MRAKIDEHWAKVYANMLTIAALLWDMRLFEHFLRSKLLEEYAKEPYVVSGPTLSLAELLRMSVYCRWIGEFEHRDRCIHH